MNRVVLWDLALGREVTAVENLGNAFALSRDGRFFAVSRGEESHLSRHQGGGVFLGVEDSTRTLTVREALTGQVIHAFPATEGATILALSPDDSRLVVGKADGSLAVLDLMPKADEKPPPLEPADLERLWLHLSSEAAPAYAAVWKLAGAADQSVPFLRSRLTPVKWDRTKTNKWLNDLDSDDFEAREVAAKELRRLGAEVELQLRGRMKDDVSPEVRRSLTELLDAVESRSIPPEELRAIRAICTLERAATPAARDVLKTLAGGEPEARTTIEAKQALARLAATR